MPSIRYCSSTLKQTFSYVYTFALRNGTSDEVYMPHTESYATPSSLYYQLHNNGASNISSKRNPICTWQCTVTQTSRRTFTIGKNIEELLLINWYSYRKCTTRKTVFGTITIALNWTESVHKLKNILHTYEKNIIIIIAFLDSKKPVKFWHNILLYFKHVLKLHKCVTHFNFR